MPYFSLTAFFLEGVKNVSTAGRFGVVSPRGGGAGVHSRIARTWSVYSLPRAGSDEI